MAKIKNKVICEKCGNEFGKSPSRVKRDKTQYCLNCRKPRSENIKTNCSYCEKQISVQQSRFNKYKDHFCNRDCFSKFKRERILVTCDICKKDFEKIPSKVSENNFCSYNCYAEYRKVLSRESGHRTLLTCEFCKKEFERPMSKLYSGINGEKYKKNFCSTECRSKYCVGENNPNYKPDRSKIAQPRKTIRMSKDMNDWRDFILKRDNYTCQVCQDKNKKGRGSKVKFNVHHIKTFVHLLLNDRNNLYNTDYGICLCEKCHLVTIGKETCFENLFNEIVMQQKQNNKIPPDVIKNEWDKICEDIGLNNK